MMNVSERNEPEKYQEGNQKRHQEVTRSVLEPGRKPEKGKAMHLDQEENQNRVGISPVPVQMKMPDCMQHEQR
jgi:hypothetical protein